jgi:hypothetical protein
MTEYGWLFGLILQLFAGVLTKFGLMLLHVHVFP